VDLSFTQLYTFGVVIFLVFALYRELFNPGFTFFICTHVRAGRPPAGEAGSPSGTCGAIAALERLGKYHFEYLNLI
jgi:hypothetical protein